MKVLEFLAKIKSTVPSAFPLHYAVALGEEKRSRGRSLVRSRGAARATACSRVPPRDPSSAQ